MFGCESARVCLCARLMCLRVFSRAAEEPDNRKWKDSEPSEALYLVRWIHCYLELQDLSNLTRMSGLDESEKFQIYDLF